MVTSHVGGQTPGVPLLRPTRRLLPGLTRTNLGRELTAGVTLVAISVPLNIGYAQIAGLPPQAGLYALVLPSLLFALTASSRQLVVAPDAAAAALVASSLLGLGVASGTEQYAAMAAAQAIVGGVFFLVCSRLKLGFLADFLSEPILVGFVGGLALEILVSQVAKMLGLSLGPGEFFEGVATLFTSLGETHLLSAAVAAAGLVVLLLGRHLAPALPWALVVMVSATLASHVCDLPSRGVDVLGHVPAGLPPLALPHLSLEAWLLLIPSAAALTAITVAEGLMLARSYSDRRGYPQDPDRDLAGFGLANIGAGLTGGLSVGSSTSRTAAMDDSGSRTQLPSIVLAVSALALLLLGTELLAAIPSPAIGAVVTMAVLRLLGLHELRRLLARSRDEFVIAALCFLGVLAVGPLMGLLLAFVLGLVNLARRSAAPRVALLTDPRHRPAPGADLGRHTGETVPGALVLRLDGPLFFANARAISDEVRRLVDDAPHPVRQVVLDLESVTDVDTTAADALDALVHDLTAAEVRVTLSRVPAALEGRLAALGVLVDVERAATNRQALVAHLPRHRD